MTGFGVDPQVLRSAAKKITDSVREVDGVKVEDLGESPGDFGHSDAQNAFSELMATWNVALTKTLKEDAEGSAEKLEKTASGYEAAEVFAGDSFAPPAIGVT
jgi:hypothetical protein